MISMRKLMITQLLALIIWKLQLNSTVLNMQLITERSKSGQQIPKIRESSKRSQSTGSLEEYKIDKLLRNNTNFQNKKFECKKGSLANESSVWCGA